ncbi:UNVERIFIED_CONTAM: hypothetical protein O8I53_06125 [Campylobacter lari]
MNKKAIFIPLGVITGVTAIATPGIVYAAYRQKHVEKSTIQSESNLNETNELLEEKKDPDRTIFPKLNAQNYYKYIVIENKQAKLKSEVVSEILKDVYKNLIISDSSIEFDFELTDKLLKMYFRSKNGTKIINKTYVLSINDDELRLNEH